MTGDISNLGLPAEFQLARNWLETLGAREDVSFVPGNHDAYVRGSLPYLARAFAPWTTGEPSASEVFPYLRIRGEVALVGLSSGVPTPLFIAAGYLGRRQLQAAERLLVETGRRGFVRVVMLHHPPQTAASQLGRGLVDAGGLAALIRRAGAELIVHGHNHRLCLARMDGPKGLVPVVGVPSASGHSRDAAFSRRIPSLRDQRRRDQLQNRGPRPGAVAGDGRRRRSRSARAVTSAQGNHNEGFPAARTRTPKLVVLLDVYGAACLPGC